MDINLLQQILTGLQQNNIKLTTLLNNQAQQIAQQMTITQPIQPTTSATGKIAKPEPFNSSPEKLDVFLQELYLNFEDDAVYFSADHMQKNLLCIVLHEVQVHRSMGKLYNRRTRSWGLYL